MTKSGVNMFNNNFEGTVLITGGTGTLGNALTERLLGEQNESIEKIIIFSRDEFKQHEMRLKFLNKKICTDEVIYNNFASKVEFQIGDIRDYHSVVRVLKGVDVVFNTAAIKQVPVAEYNPMEAIKTNIMGTNNIINAIIEHDMPIHTVVGISTDKACLPINAYGMTKALMERLIIAANIKSNTNFVLTRYGNVMASRGSVIPLFRNQLLLGQDITITDPYMTRFMMNIDQAVDTIIDTYNHAGRGEIFVPKIPSARIMDVAKVMIGNKNINIRFTGIRPGEKLHEDLISNVEMRRTYDNGITYDRSSYYIIKPELPELRENDIPCEVDMDKYTSEDKIMNEEEVGRLLSENNLL
jgi:UDP-glucose 4-epimerase